MRETPPGNDALAIHANGGWLRDKAVELVVRRSTRQT